MNNFFLYNNALAVENIELFKKGLSELILIKRDSHFILDHFWKHESIWSLDIIQDIFSDSQTTAALMKFLQHFDSLDTYIENEEFFDDHFKEMSNGFLGVDFINTNILIERRICNRLEFKEFKTQNLRKNITFRNLWSKSELLFNRIILCGEVEDQLQRTGESGYFNQILEKLIIFDETLLEWEEGDFDYKHIKNSSSLNISPESAQTLALYGNQRSFSLPGGTKEIFDLHIKTGDLRFHFFPDNKLKKVYVGYIGKHLKLASED